MGFITEEDYFGKHFRIGKALNPSLEKEIREREGVYDKIVVNCGGRSWPKRCGVAGKNAGTFFSIGFRMRKTRSL